MKIWMKTLERISKNSSLSLSSRCGGAFDPPKDSFLRELSSATVLKSDHWANSLGVAGVPEITTLGSLSHLGGRL